VRQHHRRPRLRWLKVESDIMVSITGHRPSRRIFSHSLASFSILAAVQPVRVLAAYPERPISMIVPFAAGGAIDIIARVLSEPLSKALGQTIVIENRPGAGGNIGVGAAARAQPDGYTILMGSSSFAINPSLYARVPYDPFKDFVPVADLVFYPCVIAARTNLGVNSLAELIAIAKRQPGKLNYATPGTGTMPHLAAEMLKLRAGIDMVHVPYTSGGQAVQSLIAGTVDVASLATPQALPQVKVGQITALAGTGRERWPELPDIPTLREAGFNDVIAETWQGLFMPAGTPDAVVERIALETSAILARPEIVEKFRQVGLFVVGKGPQALRARLAEEVPRWKEVIEKAAIKAE
jgi:tripartite-type tricarboxylate transporter receptor subunit TctC